MHLVIDLEVLALNGALSSNARLHDPTFCRETHCNQLPLNGLEDQLPSEVLLLETPSPEVASWKHHVSAVVGEPSKNQCQRSIVEGVPSKKHH